MDMLLLLTLLLCAVSASRASFESDMAALDKALMDEEQSTENVVKKAVKDLSTEELIEELEKEFHKDQKKEASATDIAGKYRKQFEDIINKKAKLDEMVNADVTAITKKQVLVNPVDELIKIMADESNGKEEKRVSATEECKDVRTDCESLKSYCETHEHRLHNICRKTCGFCDVPCRNTVSKQTCLWIRKMGSCKTNNKQTNARVAKLCPVTCGFCNVPSPPKCSQTKNGCCWDKVTIKQGKDGNNCPACMNKYKYLCKTFKQDCKSFYRPGDFMRANCPKVCGLCDGKCADDSKMLRKCPFWKNTLNWCKLKKDLMMVYCPVTCEYC